ncbi:protein IQ-DOMAIN 14-like [Hordeum vulgare]|nr:protein IQ-DOMAIN 14-like [Hordeum vulgare]
MGKAGRWLRSILAGKKGGGQRGDKRGQSRCDSTPLAGLPVAASPREKRRWSFRRPAPPVKAAATPSPLALEPGGLSVSVAVAERELEESKHAVAVAMAAADAAVIRLTPPEAEDDLNLYATPFQEPAAARIQATFRGYLARKALCALRGLVKLQALIRGHLVRKQARATLRRLQALLMAQTRVHAQRMRMLEDEDHAAAAPVDRWSPQHPRRRRSYVSPHASAST